MSSKLVYSFSALSCVYITLSFFFFFFLRVFWKFLFGLHCKFFKFKYLTLRVFKLKKKKMIKHKDVTSKVFKKKEKWKGNRHWILKLIMLWGSYEWSEKSHTLVDWRRTTTNNDGWQSLDYVNQNGKIFNFICNNMKKKKKKLICKCKLWKKKGRIKTKRKWHKWFTCGSVLHTYVNY